jgi:hypothetical protein
LLQADPQDPNRRTPVLLSLAHIVRLIPQYYEESGGTRMVTDLEPAGGAAGGEDARASERSLKRFFLILDDLGGTFESHTASEKAQRMLDQLWTESA